jgi:predicted ATPase
MSKFIKSFTLKKDHHKIKPFKLDFRDGFNVIVGENGSGKSTLLHLITDVSENLKDIRHIDCEHETEFRFLDTEKHNPRIKGGIEYSKTIGFDIASRFMSHGETMLPMILASEEFRNTILIVDEPEGGISLTNQIKIFDTLQMISIKNNCQVIVTTHSYVIMKKIDMVFDMKTKKWTTSKKYLASLKLGDDNG